MNVFLQNISTFITSAMNEISNKSIIVKKEITTSELFSQQMEDVFTCCYVLLVTVE